MHHFSFHDVLLYARPSMKTTFVRRSLGLLNSKIRRRHRCRCRRRADKIVPRDIAVLIFLSFFSYFSSIFSSVFHRVFHRYDFLFKNISQFLKIEKPVRSGPGLITKQKTEYGGVAQLGERRVRNAEVMGSNPTISTDI